MYESVRRTSRPFTFSLVLHSFMICAPGVEAAGGLYGERSLSQIQQLGCLSGIVEEYI